MDTNDLYKRLNISKTANNEEIKKAYKKGALKWHPDRNSHQKEIATENFKKINEAYEILSDVNKRQIYDQFGMKGFEDEYIRENDDNLKSFSGMNANYCNFPQGFPFTTKTTSGFADPNQIFGMFFNNNGNMFQNEEINFFKSKFKNNSFKSEKSFNEKKCINYDIYINLEVLYTGGKKKFKITNNCREKIFEIDIKSGWKTGTKIQFDDEIDGKITFVLNEKPHELFKRNENDLIYKYKINQDKPDKNIILETLSKKKLNINLSNKIKGEKITISNEGMPIRKNGIQKGFGDLIIELI